MASFRKRNGKWEYRFTIKLPNGKRQEISKAGFKTKALATAAALDAESKIKRSTVFLLNGPTFIKSPMSKKKLGPPTYKLKGISKAISKTPN